MNDILHNIVTFLSLALTPAALIGCLGVVTLWWQSAINALQTKDKAPYHWFLIGVLVSFIGSLVDNTYWGVAWYAEYVAFQGKELLFDNGVYSNLPFRQICTLVAAACHIKAAHAVFAKDPSSHNLSAFSLFMFKRFIPIAAGLTILTSLTLILVKL